MAERQLGQLTDRQREVWQLYQEGNSVRKIGSLLGISECAAHRHLQAAQRKFQEQEELAQLIEEVPGGTAKTVKELKVLALVGKGMTIKQAATCLNESENSLRLILNRKGISAKDFSRRELTPEEKEAYAQMKSPCEEEMERLKDKFLLKVLRASEEEEDVLSAELEVALRAAGFIHKTSQINAKNRATLNILRAQSKGGHVVFVLSKVEMRILRKELKQCGINRGLDYFGAKLIYVEKDVPEDEPSHFYAIDRFVLSDIQNLINSGLEKIAG